MAENPRTGAERYFAKRMKSADYSQAYERARVEVALIDFVMNSLDSRRCELGWSKAELARRADLKPAAVRRLFSSESANPTLSTVAALAGALNLEIVTKPRDEPARAS